MRVLVVAKDFPSALAPNDGIFVLRQARALAELGHEILVVRVVPHAPAWTPKWRAYRAIPAIDTVDGIEVRTLRAFFPPRMIGLEYLPLQIGRPLAHIVAEFAPDVVHAHFLIPSGQVAVRQNLPSILTAHGSDAYDWAWRRRGLRRAAREAIAKAGAVVAVSDFIRQRVRALYPRDVHVVFNGADESVFAPRDALQARVAAEIAPGRFAIAFAGRPTQAKGAFDLVDAVARLGDVRPLLLVAGPGDDAALRAHAAARGVEARFCGTLAHPELAAMLAASDVFCLPSYHEGLPASICEAMLAARPVVATQVGGIPEIVRNGESGYLVAPGDADVLAQRLRALANDSDLTRRMGAAGNAFARRELTWRVNAQRYERLFREATAAAK